ncbi:MAG: hypothetical protein K6G18_08100 [Treponema sp.]|nr:hypothetical protein [Treponema sp.]
MTGEEKYRILDSIKLENGFFLIDEQDCREENTSKIDNMEGIFDLKDSSDYTYLFAIAELLADKDKAEAVKGYLLEENSRSKEDVKQPEWEDKLLVSTAMEDNPLFFSMAWNWACLTEARVVAQAEQADDEEDFWIERLAASTGNTQFGEKTVEGLGVLFIDCREKYGEFFVGLKLSENVPGTNRTLRQRIQVKDSGKELDAVIRLDGGNDIVFSQPFSVDESGNPANGFRYIGGPETIDEE